MCKAKVDVAQVSTFRNSPVRKAKQLDDAPEHHPSPPKDFFLARDVLKLQGPCLLAMLCYGLHISKPDRFSAQAHSNSLVKSYKQQSLRKPNQKRSQSRTKTAGVAAISERLAFLHLGLERRTVYNQE